MLLSDMVKGIKDSKYLKTIDSDLDDHEITRLEKELRDARDKGFKGDVDRIKKILKEKYGIDEKLYSSKDAKQKLDINFIKSVAKDRINKDISDADAIRAHKYANEYSGNGQDYYDKLKEFFIN
jgi:predicted DsbA family dithiol-disulfide isomerase